MGCTQDGQQVYFTCNSYRRYWRQVLQQVFIKDTLCFGNHFHYCAVSVLQSGLNHDIILTVKVSQSTTFN